jgi:hypothetical protein
MSHNINNSISREPSEVSRIEDYGNTNTGFFSTCANALKILKEGFFVRYVPFENENDKTQTVAKKSSHRLGDRPNKTAVVMMVGILVISAFSSCVASSPQPLSEKHYVQFNDPFVVENEHCLIEKKPAEKSPTEAYLKKYPISDIADAYKTFQNAMVVRLEREPDSKEREKLKEQDRSLRRMQKLLKNKELFNEIIKSEKEAVGFIPVYRAVKGKGLIYRVLNALYENSKNITLPKDFILLKATAKYRNAKEFLDQNFPSVPLSDQSLILFSKTTTPYSDEAVALAWGLVSGEIAEPNVVIVNRNKAELVKMAKDFPWTEKDSFESDDACLLKWVKIQRLSLAMGAFGGEVKKGKEFQGTIISAEEEKLAHRLHNKRKSVEVQNALENFKLKTLHPGSDLDPKTRPDGLAMNLNPLGACVQNAPTKSNPKAIITQVGECSLLYWISAIAGPNAWESREEFRRKGLEEVLNLYGIPLEEIQTLENIYKDLKPEDDELLLQIFIPKVSSDGRNLVDEIVYPSLANGIPFSFYRDRVPFSQVLEDYGDNVDKVLEPDEIQARVVITEDGILNPKSGVRFKTYYPKPPSQERIDAYLGKIKTWAEGALAKRV